MAFAAVVASGVDDGPRRFDDRRLGGDVAADGDLSLFVVAAAAAGADLREDEPDESRSAAPAVRSGKWQWPADRRPETEVRNRSPAATLWNYRLW